MAGGADEGEPVPDGDEMVMRATIYVVEQLRLPAGEVVLEWWLDAKQGVVLLRLPVVRIEVGGVLARESGYDGGRGRFRRLILRPGAIPGGVLLGETIAVIDVEEGVQ